MSSTKPGGGRFGLRAKPETPAPRGQNGGRQDPEALTDAGLIDGFAAAGDVGRAENDTTENTDSDRGSTDEYVTLAHASASPIGRS